MRREKASLIFDKGSDEQITSTLDLCRMAGGRDVNMKFAPMVRADTKHGSNVVLQDDIEGCLNVSADELGLIDSQNAIPPAVKAVIIRPDGHIKSVDMESI